MSAVTLQAISYHQIDDEYIRMALLQQWHKVFSSQHAFFPTIATINGIIKRKEAPSSSVECLNMCKRAFPVVNAMLSTTLANLYSALQNKSPTPVERNISYHIIETTHLVLLCQNQFSELCHALILHARRK